MIPGKSPIFMPVGTNATVKSLSPDDLHMIGATTILANNYHLFLRPGPKIIKKMGGLHKFMGWPKTILTDSGGFQLMSLGKEDISLCDIDDLGVTFRSHLDGGTLHRFTPEKAIKSQIDLGADIIMAFDCPVPEGADRKTAEICVKRTHAWLDRCIKTLNTTPFPPPNLGGGIKEGGKPALFGIIQGGVYPDLLKQSAEFVASKNLPGIAVGGAVIGRNQAQTADSLASIREFIPRNKPLYAMGVGVKPSDLTSVFQAGADMCDCVAPTRLARTGYLYNREFPHERLDINKSAFLTDKKPADEKCDCYTCARFTRSYLHHLFKNRELLYYRLASIHNLRTMIRTAEDFSTTP